MGNDFAHRLGERLRHFDPGGAYARYAAYVTLLACVAGAVGFALTATVARAEDAEYCAIYAALVTGLALMLANPDPTRRSTRAIAAVGGAIAIAAGLNSLAAHNTVMAQLLLVVAAFTGFYVRRWPEPWPSAGLLGLIALLIHQIISEYAPSIVMSLAILPAVLGVALGYAMMPRAMFSRELVLEVRRLRASVPLVLRARIDTVAAARATVRQIDTLLTKVNSVREQADRFNGAADQGHLALVHKTAVVARVWENAAEYLQGVAGVGTNIPSQALAAARDARLAVADALDNGSSECRNRARDALDVLDQEIGDSIVRTEGESEDAGFAQASVFDLLNVELTLSHLLDAVAQLDEEIALWAEHTT